ncbi:unnamed protein product [Closterium sp. NIES-64]|nr:unnamed protein product [Closterium sp. NIES-64]
MGKTPNFTTTLPVHIKRAICLHQVENLRLRHVDLARWCYSQYHLRPDRSTIGRILKSADRWAVVETGDNPIRRRGGAWPELEQAMARWISNAGPASVPLTLQTIRDHVATMALNMGIPPTFRCSIGWVRRALRRQGLPHVHDDEPTPSAYPDIELDDEIGDVGTLIPRLRLGHGAMSAAEYVAIDDDEPTCAEHAADLTPNEPGAGMVVEMWEAPTTMQAVYEDVDPVGREARRTARAACEMLIGYARAISIQPCNLCHLFNIRNPGEPAH